MSLVCVCTFYFLDVYFCYFWVMLNNLFALKSPGLGNRSNPNFIHLTILLLSSVAIENNSFLLKLLQLRKVYFRLMVLEFQCMIGPCHCSGAEERQNIMVEEHDRIKLLRHGSQERRKSYCTNA